MSDVPKHTKGELILSRNTSLATTKSGLVKRGLELVSNLKKSNLKVLVSDSDSNLGKFFYEMVKRVMGDEYHITYLATPYADEILEHAKNNEFDIFILITNNVIFRLDKPPWKSSSIEAGRLATYLKKTYRKPLVCITGGGFEYYWAAEQAGADLNFLLPVKFKEFEAIKHLFADTPKS